MTADTTTAKFSRLQQARLHVPVQACDEPGLHDRHPPVLPRQQPGHAGEEDTAREYTHLSHQVEPGQQGWLQPYQ